MPETKICTKCGKELPATSDYFYKGEGLVSGIRNDCKSCRSEYNKQYRQTNETSIKLYLSANKETISKRRKIYNQANKEVLTEKRKIYEQKNRVTIAAKAKLCKKSHRASNAKTEKLYKQANKEAISAVQRKYRDDNAERLKQYREDNKEHIAERHKKYVKENPDKYKIYAHKRNAMKRKLPNTLTEQQWAGIKLAFNNTCAYCGRVKKLTVEHFISVNKLGELTINNVLPVCGYCNSSKRDRDFSEWYPAFKYYSKKRESKILKYLGYKNNIQQLSLM